MSVAQPTLHHIHVMIPETQTMVVCAVSTAGGGALEVSSPSSSRGLLATILGPLRKMLGMEQMPLQLFGNLCDS